MTQSNWKGKRVVIIGAARQGLALARYLAGHGAEVVLNDRRQPEQLAAEMESLASYKIEWATGGHPLEILDHPIFTLLLEFGDVFEFRIRNRRKLAGRRQVKGRSARRYQRDVLDAEVCAAETADGM